MLKCYKLPVSYCILSEDSFIKTPCKIYFMVVKLNMKRLVGFLKCHYILVHKNGHSADMARLKSSTFRCSRVCRSREVKHNVQAEDRLQTTGGLRLVVR